MKIDHIEIKNFRQYYGLNQLDLSTSQDKNIILLGGRNGYGKTNLLLSIVWCLYGDQISNVDQNFKKEIQKEKNYASFMQQSLNWSAAKENKMEFYVQLEISGLDFPDLGQLGSSISNLILTRVFNVSSKNENLSIKLKNSKTELFDDESDKINFINDYVMPIDAAKFVFFDAEKISEIANLSIKEEGHYLNDALSKILGLDNYDTLIEDIKLYESILKKNGASKNLQEQILEKEQTIEISRLEINSIEENNAELQKRVEDFKKEVRSLDVLLNQYSKQGNSLFDRDAVVLELDSLYIKQAELNDAFNEMGEIIPLIILTGKLEEVSEHIRQQEIRENYSSSNIDIKNKVERFIELLFNTPPEPESSQMSFKDKVFYNEKAENIAETLFFSEENALDLDFEYDLNKSDKEQILTSLELINTQSTDMFKDKIDGYNEIQNRIFDLKKILTKVDADLEDDLVVEYYSKKELIERSIEDSTKERGINEQKVNKLNQDIIRLNQQLVTLMKKVDVNEYNRSKIEVCQKYINVLELFLEEQKNRHKISLEKNILKELRNLMHKLGNKDSNIKFIEDVRVTILTSGQGMKISLLDQNDKEIRKESLSSGEKQIYISCLIKALLSESVQPLPIFIDTPLGRLDEQHRDSLTQSYYPSLSEQVVLFSTNSEITPKRYMDIKQNISNSYLLKNDGNNTTFVEGYFKKVL